MSNLQIAYDDLLSKMTKIVKDANEYNANLEKIIASLQKENLKMKERIENIELKIAIGG